MFPLALKFFFREYAIKDFFLLITIATALTQSHPLNRNRAKSFAEVDCLGMT